MAEHISATRHRQGELDILFVDLPPGTGDVALSLHGLVPDARLIIVTTPQLAAHRVAARSGRMATDAQIQVAGVVENMSAVLCRCCGTASAVFGEGGGTHLASQLGVPLLGQVSLDINLCEAGDAGGHTVLRDPESRASRELRRIAAALPTGRPSLAGRHLPLFPT